jgi:aspartate/methionine/tyrosine aminotransferase
MFDPVARPEVQALRASKIREVANAAWGRENVLTFWFGESDRPTPEFIREAGARSLMEGRTFYGHNLGQARLRETLAAYLTNLHGVPIAADRIAVTNSGVNALMVVAQTILSPGDKACVVTPVWPNVQEIPRVMGARMTGVPLTPAQGRWRLDLEALFTALEGAKALFLNSPNNPTGWTLPAEDRAAILDHCRARGIWLVADDVYERLVFGPGRTAPSFLELATSEDRVIGVNSFSKAWRMTGWRLGWMVLPPALMDAVGVLLEYNTSCAPDFVQDAAVVAVEQGEPEIAAMKAELAAAKDQVLGALRAMPGVEAPEPDGGMYAFFRIAGCADSVAMAKALIEKAGLGLAPGSAFGDQGEGWLRWCFAARPEKNAAGLERLERFLRGR